MAKLKKLPVTVRYAATAILLVLCLVFGFLWANAAKKANRETTVIEKICTQSAKYAAGALHSYVEREGLENAEQYYLSGVADYNVFLSMYYNLYASDEAAVADYMVCFEIYDKMLTDPEIVYPHLDDFVHTLSELSDDLRNRDIMNEMQEIRDAIVADSEAATAEETETEALA